MNKKLTIIPLAIALTLSVTACGSKKEEPVEIDEKPAVQEVVFDENAEAISVSAADLSDKYRSNEAISDKEFKNSVAEITGVVEGSGEEEGRPYIMLKGHETEKSPAIVCFGAFEGTREGDEVTVKGLINGKTSIAGERNFVGIEGASLK